MPPTADGTIETNSERGSTDSHAHTLKPGVLGVTAVAFLVVSAAAPLNLLAGYGPLGYMVGGLGAPVGFVLAGLVLATFVAGFMAMSRYMHRPGTFYAYVERGLGKDLGRGAAAVALISYLAIQVGAMGILATVSQSLIDNFFGLHVHWAIIAVVLQAIIWYLGRRGIDIGTKVLGVLLFAEIGILAVIAVCVLVKGGSSEGIHAGSFAPSNVFTSGMAASSVVWFGAFLGIEYTAIYRAETRDPERTLPRAAYVSLIFLAVFYCFVSWAIVQAFGDSAIATAAGDHPTDMVYLVAERYVGTWAGDLTQILMVTSSIASGLAYFNAISRYGHSMAGEGMLPKRMSRVHPVYRSPNNGNLQAVITVGAVFLFTVAGLDPYSNMVVWMSTPGVLGIIVLMTLTAVAVVSFFWRRQQSSHDRWIIAVSTVSALLLGTVTYLLIDNVALMTGSTGAVNTFAVTLPFAALLLVAVVSRLRGGRGAVAAIDTDA
ncbi:APC family permease [Streptomyces sp. NPDC047042]|uniref:APC family permease n=1 Tax=Streptomyces sp. NPDC047042 TaxID=3154807 RepID=UPI0033DB7C8B